MNGTPAGFFFPSRGLRQGDPLSPLLFVLCTEGFAALLRQAISEGKLQGVKVAPRAPRISHLFFADDSYLFLRGSLQECENLIEVLNEYEELSGQRVNLDKSAVCFSKNIALADQEFLAAILGVGAVGVHDKYLGLPSLIARSKMDTFRYLEEKLLARLQGWKRRTLSWAAKETLIKSVALALPLHVMSYFKLPLALCRLLDKHVARFWWGVEEGKSKIRWISWRNLCSSKHEGGMGFRRFEFFNQALLAKIGWRILEEPQSLLAQVYKGKYFPNGTFLTAQARSRPSWGWQSILFGRQLLESGLRWQIGNGQKAPLLMSSWIPQQHPRPPVYNPRVVPSGEGLKVKEVIHPGEGRWDDQKLRHWFDPETCRAIKTIPLSRLNIEDKLIWHPTSDGIFSVKSVYYVAVNLDRQRGRWKALVSWMDKPSWIRLWEADLPPKLRVFVWQIFHRILPTMEALREKEVDVLPRCPVCWEASETLEHMFLECPVARALWDYSGLAHLGEGLPRHTFPLFLRKLLAVVHSPALVMSIVAILWRIWRSRNWVVFEGKQFAIPALMRQFHQQVQEWLSLPRDQTVQIDPTPAPTIMFDGADTAICMWDGAVRLGSHAAEGMVILNSERAVILAKGVHFPFLSDPLMVEALALREAIGWCLANGFTMMRFEGDAKVIIEKILWKDIRDSHIGVILEEIVNSFASNLGLSIRFVGRRNNRVAHLVARQALPLFPTACRSFDFRTWLYSKM
ncbi:unnamed protein product [Linum trigynum]|uniref:Reverse transcriptase domain-containing protein n=1 Tax=Linum trigynum TaxID=586398 RepID=A0AAV2EE56_9ROSI